MSKIKAASIITVNLLCVFAWISFFVLTSPWRDTNKTIGYEKGYKAGIQQQQHYFKLRKPLYDIIHIQHVCNTAKPKVVFYNTEYDGEVYRKQTSKLRYQLIKNRIHQYYDTGEICFIATIKIYTVDGSPLTKCLIKKNGNELIMKKFQMKVVCDGYETDYGRNLYTFAFNRTGLSQICEKNGNLTNKFRGYTRIFPEERENGKCEVIDGDKSITYDFYFRKKK